MEVVNRGKAKKSATRRGSFGSHKQPSKRVKRAAFFFVFFSCRGIYVFLEYIASCDASGHVCKVLTTYRASMSSTATDNASLLNKLDSIVPAHVAQFDAFPKIPSTYKARSESRGFMTVLVALLGLLLLLNDISEFIWGWPDQEFSIDTNKQSYLNINVDITVNMPCKCESFSQPTRDNFWTFLAPSP